MDVKWFPSSEALNVKAIRDDVFVDLVTVFILLDIVTFE